MSTLTHTKTARDTVVKSANILQIDLLGAVRTLLQRQLDVDLLDIDATRQELALLENGRLHVHRRGDRYSFGFVPHGATHETGITGDSERIHALARRAFLEKKLSVSKARIHVFSRTLDRLDAIDPRLDQSNRLARLGDAGLDLSRILFTRDQNDWIDRPYSPNPYHPENLKYKTKGGVLMRSKSEIMLGNELELLGIPYRYDDLVTIETGSSGDQPFRESYFADFKLPNLLAGITIHEHLGAFQVTQYGDNALMRLNDYNTFTVVELANRPVKHQEFTWSMEYQLKDPALLKETILKMLFPGLL